MRDYQVRHLDWTLKMLSEYLRVKVHVLNKYSLEDSPINKVRRRITPTGNWFGACFQPA
jgi:hypothetical protein